jgi:adenylosuccinate synthase
MGDTARQAGPFLSRPRGTATIVLGAQWGDEGKGKITNLLAEDADVVVRFQGGANAGHTVVIRGEQIILHQVPSGITSRGALNVIGNGCVVDLEGLAAEIDDLDGHGVRVTPDNLLLSSSAHLVTPAHKLVDRLHGGRIGTTGRGIGPCYTDKARRTGIRAESVLDGSLERRLADQARECRAVIDAARNCDVLASADFDAALAPDRVLAAAGRLAPFIGDVTLAIHGACTSGKRLLFEGAQGTFLDIDHGTYPFVTSSTTTIGGAYAGTGVFVELGRRIGVVKAYTTRVGHGPFPTELTGSLEEMLRERGHEYGATTGRPRRCGWLDLHLVRRASIANGFTEIALTKLDVLSSLEAIDVAVGRDGAGAPVYETLTGWREPIDRIARYEDLPARCRDYVAFIERQLETPVVIISLGADRDATIVRQGRRDS